MNGNDLPARAKALQPLLGEHAEYGDEHGCLAPEVVEALHREGMFKMWEPRAVGGFELDPIRSLEQFGKAEASFRAARAFVREAWVDMSETCVNKGAHGSVRQHTLVRLALTNVTQVLHEVSNFVYLNAGTQHVTSVPAVVQACGRELAGLAPTLKWQFLDLVPQG